ncbi:MAG: hypothetical protein A2Y78_00210 [Acidobacteria bacterium RBG_13_68_16]|nr:MAG: hypothetical protein A2Y78_00210 [Acidobacteria bacterium RBG_13_68_16]
MANNDFPLYNGVAPSWADVEVLISGLDMPLLQSEDVKAVNTSATVEVGTQYAGGRPKARTTGQASYEASLTLYRSGYDKLLRGLQAAAEAKGYVRGDLARISLVNFNVTLRHTPPGSDAIFEVQMLGCRVLARTLNSTQGTDPDEVEVPLSVLEIADVVDGKNVVLL